MPFLMNVLYHPRKLFLRRALFQVHLWMGILLSVYVALIGLSGSALVFDDELRAYAMRDLRFDPAHLAGAQQVLSNARQAFPGEPPTYLMWPSRQHPAYAVYLGNVASQSRTVLADSTDGHLLTTRPKLVLDTVHDFHVYLLMGQTGFVVNCVAGIGLLVLALSGAVLWWPGLRLWFRGFRVNLRGSWKRINYDSHNLVGILTLAIVSVWGASTIDFLWPGPTAKVVALFSPLRGMQQPGVPVTPKCTNSADPRTVLASVLTQTHTLNPQGFLSGIAFSKGPAGSLTVYVDTAEAGDFSHRDIHTFDGATGRLLSTWHYGRNQTVGDWIVWLVYPLHFGTLWGTPVKVLWCLLGLSLPILSVTGLLMYWNRYLGKRWHHLVRRDDEAA